MYRVLQHFVDLQDHNHPYNAGDVFPREGLQVTAERLAELSGPNNLQKKPLIMRIIVEEPPVKAAPKRQAKKVAE